MPPSAILLSDTHYTLSPQNRNPWQCQVIHEHALCHVAMTKAQRSAADHVMFPCLARCSVAPASRLSTSTNHITSESGSALHHLSKYGELWRWSSPYACCFSSRPEILTERQIKLATLHLLSVSLQCRPQFECFGLSNAIARVDHRIKAIS